MICPESTASVLASSTPFTQGGPQTTPRSGRRAVRAVMILAGGSLAIGGCISVKAPDKPIVIELNINIKQEVIYRLSADAANTIDKHPEIF